MSARLKTPEQVVAELDRLREGGAQSVYFVDDNFIANPKAALDLLPHLVACQQRHRFPLRIACEATLNIAKNETILGLMREAGFVTIFCGIETPELWQRLLGRLVSEYGRLCHGDGGPRAGRASPEGANVALYEATLRRRHLSDPA